MPKRKSTHVPGQLTLATFLKGGAASRSGSRGRTDGAADRLKVNIKPAHKRSHTAKPSSRSSATSALAAATSHFAVSTNSSKSNGFVRASDVLPSGSKSTRFVPSRGFSASRNSFKAPRPNAQKAPPAKAKHESAKAPSLSGTSSTSLAVSPVPPQNALLPTVIVGRQHHPYVPTSAEGLTLLRDFGNRYDRNAVMVVDTNIHDGDMIPLGHIPRRIAAFVGPLMDVGIIEGKRETQVRLVDGAKIDSAFAGDPTTVPVMLHLHLVKGANALTQQSYKDFETQVRVPWPIICQALSNLGKSLAKSKRKAMKDTSKAAAKRARNEGPQQRTLQQAFSRASRKKTGPTTLSAQLLQDVLPSSLLQYIFMVGGLSPLDLCAVRCVCSTWKCAMDNNSFMQYECASFRLAIDVVRLAANDKIFAQQEDSGPRAGEAKGVPQGVSSFLHWCKSSWAPSKQGCGESLAMAEARAMLLNVVDDKKVSHSEMILGRFSCLASLHDSRDGWLLLAVALLFTLHGEARHKLVQRLVSPWTTKTSAASTIRGITRREFVYSILCALKVWIAIDDQRENHYSSPLLRNVWSRAHAELTSSVARGASFIQFPRGRHLTSQRALTRPALTDEQLAVISTRLGRRDTIKVAAFAGSGKTTTLVELAREHPDQKFLYLAFNVSVREHAERIFPKNTCAKSLHQLAFARVGFAYANRLVPSLQANNVMDFCERLHTCPITAQAIVDTLDAFFCSADVNICLDHVPAYVPQPKQPLQEIPQDDSMSIIGRFNDNNLRADQILRITCLVWKSMKSRGSDSNYARHSSPSIMPMSHNGYLKLFQLRRPKLDVDYDVIMLDEAQDTNPAIQDIVMRQNCAKIVVGDRHQAIYSFIGAEDALGAVRATRTLTLTRSFRFGFRVAAVANALLRFFTTERRTLIGLGPSPGEIQGLYYSSSNDSSSAAYDRRRWWLWDKESRRNSIGNQEMYAILSRTNATLFHVAVELMRFGQDFLMIGGVDSYNFEDILDTARVILGQSRQVNNPFLRKFKSGMALKKYADATNDSEILSRLKVINECGGAEEVITITKKLIARAKLQESRLNPRQRGGADIAFLGTVHKGKGLEFDNVILADDFYQHMNDPAFRREVKKGQRGVVDEFNMIYVGVTRAKKRLRLGGTLRSFLLGSGMLSHVTCEVVTSIHSSQSKTCIACGNSVHYNGNRGHSTAVCENNSNQSMDVVGQLLDLQGVCAGSICYTCMHPVTKQWSK